jgi:DNA-binding transcriptional ArsR family regulator
LLAENKTENEMTNKTIDPELAKHAITVFRALAHDLRFQICAILVDEPLSVSTICQRLNMPQHRVSQQLALLRSSKVVTARKQSRQVFYSIADAFVENTLRHTLDESEHREVHKPNPKPDEVAASASADKKDKKGHSFEAGRFSAIR